MSKIIRARFDGALDARREERINDVLDNFDAVPSRAAARLPHLTPHDVAEIDAEVRAVLTEVAVSDVCR
jgi:phage terminase Nu1 subunit (DNA packaging protein)